jgi:uncharacterized protein (TIGR02996 family)
MARTKPAASAPPRPELLSLLQACKEEPQDDAPRLVLADWLEEHGDEHDVARAEFIRVQCQLARLPEKDPAWGALRRRERALRGAHSAAWLGHLRGEGRRLQFERGLIRVQADRCHYLCGPQWAESAGSEPFAWVEGIRASVTHVYEAHEFLRGPFPAGLSHLDLRGSKLGGPEARALFESSPPPALRTLDLRASRLGPASMEVLAGSTWLSSVTTLFVPYNDLGERGVRGLAASPHIARLRALDLSGNRLALNAIESLVDSPYLGNLISLTLESNHLRTPVVVRLAESRLMGQLVRLDLRSGRPELGAKGVEVLAGSLHTTQLEEFDLGFNGIGDRGVLALAGSPHLANLRNLNVCYNGITDQGAAALAESTTLTRLVRLELEGNSRVGQTGRRALRKRFGKAVTF